MEAEKQSVSVVICAFNGEAYIREQIDSVLKQTYPVFEIIIQDDCSTDNTWSIVKEYETRFPGLVRCFQNETNLYWFQNFYSAILKTKGDFVALCDQDDIWLPEKIGKQVEAIGNNLLNVCGHYYWENEKQTPVFAKETTALESFFWPQYSLHTMLISREMIDDFVCFGQQINMPCDVYFSQIGLCLQRYVTTNDLLVKWRRHEKNVTGQLAFIKVSGRGKILYCVKSLLRHEKSEAIGVGANRFVLLYEWLGKREKGNGHVFRKMEKLTWHIKQQTLVDYTIAGFMLLGMRKEFRHNSFQKTIGSVYSVFTLPFRWWYEHKDDM